MYRTFNFEIVESEDEVQMFSLEYKEKSSKIQKYTMMKAMIQEMIEEQIKLL